MTQRLLRTSVLGMLTFALLFGGGSAGTDFVHADPSASIVDLSESSPNQASQQFELRSTIAFTSNRDHPSCEGSDGCTRQDPPAPPDPPTDIYLMDQDGTNVRRLTVTAGEHNLFPVLSPDGKKIVFESNRNVQGRPGNISDLFVMDADGSELAALTRGASAGWSPDSKSIVFHASASGKGDPISMNAGAATDDSDIFVMNVDDCVAANRLANPDRTKGDCRNTAPGLLKNLTNNGAVTIDDDPDWAPAGTANAGKIVFTSLGKDQEDSKREIYVINADGTGPPTRRTTNTEEERAADWSPDGMRLAFSCWRGGLIGNPPTPEICIMNADGTGVQQLTTNTVFDVRPMWSPDGHKILFARPFKPVGVPGVAGQQLFVINENGTGEVRLTNANPGVAVAGKRPVVTALASWGVLRVPGGASTVTQPARAPAAAPVPKR